MPGETVSQQQPNGTKNAKSIMKSPIKTIHSDLKIKDTLKIMAEFGYSGLPIVSAQNNVTTPTTIASIRATFGSEIIAMEMFGAWSAFSGATINFYVVNKV